MAIGLRPNKDKYDGTKGQPAIHPRYVAAGILYGLCRGIRSSRKLEEACRYRVDFMWLVENRQMDHSTFAKFRVKFARPLKDLFKQIGRVAMTPTGATTAAKSCWRWRPVR